MTSLLRCSSFREPAASGYFVGEGAMGCREIDDGDRLHQAANYSPSDSLRQSPQQALQQSCRTISWTGSSI